MFSVERKTNHDSDWHHDSDWPVSTSKLQAISVNHNISVAMNSAAFELHPAKGAATLQSREMWNANSSLAEFCLCSLPLIRCLFFFIDSTTALVLRPQMCVCVILISFHALGKALLALRCLSWFQTH